LNCLIPYCRLVKASSEDISKGNPAALKYCEDDPLLYKDPISPATG